MARRPKLSHLGQGGEARMVDVSAKAVAERSATAEGFVSMAPETLDLILSGDAPKGDVLATARIAGIMAAKRTHELIPLCHPLSISKVELNIVPVNILVTALNMAVNKTGTKIKWDNIPMNNPGTSNTEVPMVEIMETTQIMADVTTRTATTDIAA